MISYFFRCDDQWKPKNIYIYILMMIRKLTVKEKMQLNCSMPNDNGNRRHRTEHNKKNCSLLDSARVCETERQNQPRSNKRKRAQKKLRVISSAIATTTAAGASSDVP
jgi:hypothetical protein